MISSRLFAAFIFCSALGFNLPSTASDLPDIFLSSKRSNVAYDPFLNSNTNDTAAKTTTENITYSGRAVDKVIVNKRAHQMILIKNGKEVKKFWIALSDRPVGRKMYEGDRRTPEGTYILDYKKDNSTYYKAFHISYPNAEDIKNAQKLGRRPGGMIMVHGQPASKGKYQDNVQRTDWTRGCIALLNHDLDVFLSMVDVGTPITINP